jgi:hypothetical protein
VALLEILMAKVQPNASAKPAAEPKAKKEKREKTERKTYASVRGLNVKDPNVWPLKSVPTDFDFKTMKPLGKKDFAKRSSFFEFKAARLEDQAKRLREFAKTADEKGGGKGKEKRLTKQLDKAADIMAELQGQGIDVIALLQNTKAAELLKKASEAAPAAKQEAAAAK